MENPLISIVIPAFNRGFIIERSLNSVLSQTYSDWECIIVDDGSTDNTKEVVDSYIRRDNRFIYFKNTRSKGAQGARNTGILKAKGEWILLFDSDDFMHPDYLEKFIPYLIENNNIVCCYGQMIDESTGEVIQLMDTIDSGKMFRKLLSGKKYATYQATIIRKHCLLKIGLLDEKCPSHQEWDTHLRISRQYEYTIVQDVLWDYHVGRNDAISADMTKHIQGQLYIISKNILHFRLFAYHSLLMKTRYIWEVAKSNKIRQNKATFLLKLILIVPELPIYVLITKCKKNKLK